MLTITKCVIQQKENTYKNNPKHIDKVQWFPRLKPLIYLLNDQIGNMYELLGYGNTITLGFHITL